MFKNMKIGSRLTLSFILVLLFMITIILTSLNAIRETDSRLDEIVEIYQVRKDLAHDMILAAQEMEITIHTLLLAKADNSPKDKIQRLKDQPADDRIDYFKQVNAFNKLIVMADDALVFNLLKKNWR